MSQDVSANGLGLVEQDKVNLWSPGRIGSLELPNRLIMTAMGTDFADGDGVAGERLSAFYAARARGGVGLLLTGAVSVAYPFGRLVPNALALSQEQHVDGITKIVDAVHAEGTLIGVQLNHNGHKAMMDWRDGRELWGPCPPPDSGVVDAGAPPKVYRTMSHADIAHVVSLFASAADRAKRAGVDAIEVSAAHGYLLSSFLSPFTNAREDEYGGSIENRSRFLVEVIQGIRAAVGSAFPLWCKIDSQEFLLDDGTSLEDAKVTALLAQEAGADAISASAYADPRTGAMSMMMSHSPANPGHMLPNAAAIKAVLRVPVISAGRVDESLANLNLAAGDLDFVAMGRKLLADPDLPRKLKAGHGDDVRPCVYGLVCLSEISTGGKLRCTANPEMGRELELIARPFDVARHVVVVGGGPAGLDVARRFADTGDRVTLIERDSDLGGVLKFAGLADEPLNEMLRWLRGQVENREIDVRLGTEATLPLIESLGPDMVVLATGAVRSQTPAAGVELGLLMGNDALRWALDDPGRVDGGGPGGLAAGARVALIGGGAAALRIAGVLASRGRRVTVLEEDSVLGAGLSAMRRELLVGELQAAGVAMVTSATNAAVGTGVVKYTNVRGQERSVGADHVLLLTSRAEAPPHLVDGLKAAGIEYSVIGDASELGLLDGALIGAAELVGS